MDTNVRESVKTAKILVTVLANRNVEGTSFVDITAENLALKIALHVKICAKQNVFTTNAHRTAKSLAFYA